MSKNQIQTFYTNQMKIDRYMHIPKFFKYSTPPNPVDSKLYRGGAIRNPLRLRYLQQEGFTQIIDLRSRKISKFSIERFLCELFGVKYKNFAMGSNLKELPPEEYFDAINQAIRQNKGKTYIHCQYGKHRTGLCVAHYEKHCTKKPTIEIISNLLKYGFQELEGLNFDFKNSKYRTICNNFVKKYIFTKTP